ncbi:MAG: NAD+ synthase [Planctomycetota bacterium]
MRIALCQINTTVGDFDGNRDRILAAASEARRAGARLALFPELAISGYPPEDLLLRRDFLSAQDQALRTLTEAVPPDLAVLLGTFENNDDKVEGRPLWNAASLIDDGLCRVVARKCLLPTYDVFDETRYFQPWPDPEQNIVEFGGLRLGVTICEDAWNDAEFFDQRLYGLDPVARMAQSGVDLIVNLSASPWDRRRGSEEGKDRFRLKMLKAAAERHQTRIVFCSQVGANVGMLFDGGSTGVGPKGLAVEPVAFEEVVQIIDLDAEWNLAAPEIPLVEMHRRALTVGIRDYAEKFGIERAVVGLSGGIDSAVTATLAVDALGADRVDGFAMPSRYSSDHSRADAHALAKNLGMSCDELSIDGVHQAYEQMLEPLDAVSGLAGENLQSRIRGALLMAVANSRRAVALATGNKSELAVGYCTLYGDTNGALAPIGDLWKTEVWDLARHLNADRERIPISSIEKPPSAELRPDQADTDSLPPYDRLDVILKSLVERLNDCHTVAERTGEELDTVREIYRKVAFNEFKRMQIPPALRVSERSWVGRRMPASHRFLGL